MSQTPEMAINLGCVAVAVVQGPSWQADLPGTLIAAPATIAASGTFTTSVIPTYGNPHIAVSGELTQAGTISIQRFLDAGGVIPNGAAVTGAMTAGTIEVVDSTTTLLAQSFTVAFINAGGSAGTLTNVNIALQAK